jgi:ribosomal protein L25 (general stress protein Ctc)
MQHTDVPFTKYATHAGYNNLIKLQVNQAKNTMKAKTIHVLLFFVQRQNTRVV